jgi:Ca2+-binding EF-hand superfamily protein
MIARMDTNGDGKIALAEAPERMQQRFDMFDTNGDGFIAEDEMEQLRQRMGQRRGGSSQERPTRQRGTDRPRRGGGTS